MFKTILAATDGSEHAAKAVEIAGDLAGRYGARLVLLHVVLHGEAPASLRRMAEVEHLVEPPPARSVATAPVASEMPASWTSGDAVFNARVLETIGRRILDYAASTAKDSGAKNVDTVFEDGDAADCILKCAVREEADLIVMGTRGLSDLRGLLQGSVSHKVGQLSDCPCLMVK